jgi:hypothetical protein
MLTLPVQIPQHHHLWGNFGGKPLDRKPYKPFPVSIFRANYTDSLSVNEMVSGFKSRSVAFQRVLWICDNKAF